VPLCRLVVVMARRFAAISWVFVGRYWLAVDGEGNHPIYCVGLQFCPWYDISEWSRTCASRHLKIMSYG
jgi:hypothetical protein